MQGEMVRAFDICKNAFRKERQAEQGVTAAGSARPGMRLFALEHHVGVCSDDDPCYACSMHMDQAIAYTTQHWLWTGCTDTTASDCKHCKSLPQCVQQSQQPSGDAEAGYNNGAAASNQLSGPSQQAEKPYLIGLSAIQQAVLEATPGDTVCFCCTMRRSCLLHQDIWLL